MPQLRTYKVFISHPWQYNDDYYRLQEFLNSAPNFEWENLSVPEHDPIDAGDMTDLQRRLRDQMRPAHAFLIISGMYMAHSEWIDFEIAFARRIGRPIIGILPWVETIEQKSGPSIALNAIAPPGNRGGIGAHAPKVAALNRIAEPPFSKIVSTYALTGPPLTGSPTPSPG